MSTELIDQYQTLFESLKRARKDSRHYNQANNSVSSKAALDLISAQRKLSLFLRPLEYDTLTAIYQWRFNREPVFEKEILIQKLARI